MNERAARESCCARALLASARERLMVAARAAADEPGAAHVTRALALVRDADAQLAHVVGRPRRRS